ncbi:hypothetical protein E8E13_002043 [Curvularia kusanoi]|uniref:Uncharacterized protein n=1 Tax=Curvularia kusanoi TaxID=90978 RepID=A0A9P4T4C9_CURKU|nr:hypothetical protein E8E13_002043 [Curvularia kusanoi]
MHTYIAEQKTLLPLAAASVALPTRHEPLYVRHRNIIEYCTLALILSLAASQCLILYGIHNIPFAQPSLALCAFLANLAAGLRLSIPASLPTATLLFIASPYVARPERLVVTWYCILLCYLMGSTSGALLLLWS